MEAPEILSSKKFLASALASVVGFLCLRYGLSYTDTAFVVGPLLAFVGAQGIADIGKSRAVVEADASKPDPAVTLQEALLKVLGSKIPAAPSDNVKPIEGKAP